MATNNYFPYSGTQYGAAASSPPVGYSANQAGYAVTSATPTSYNAQRTGGYDQGYTSTGGGSSFSSGSGGGASSNYAGYDYNRTLQSYDSSKTYYQQAASYSSAPTVSKTHYSAPPVRNPTPAAAAKVTAANSSSTANGAKDKLNAGGKPAAAAAATVAPSYSNYDAALYSAATMYVAQQHSKTPTGNNNWQPFKKQGGGGGSNSSSHKMRAKAPPRPQQLHYCEVCKISCAGPQTYREHLEGQKHKKREASLKMAASATTTTQNRGNSYHCELCDVTCTGNDAYAAHVRGSKHQKVVKLHQKLGKPIPSDDPKKMSKINFVPAGTEVSESTSKDGVVKVEGGGSESSPTKSSGTGGDDSNTASDNIKPVGVEYIEEMKDDEGKILSFNCKLCDCKFNDPNAKEMHMKGRRHRLQYKRKVQPDLVVDYKPTLRHRRLADARAQRAMMQAEFGNGRRGSNFGGANEESGDGMMYWDERRRFDDEFDYGNWMQRGFQGAGPRGGPFLGRGGSGGGPPGHPFFGMMPGRRPESTDDRHAIARHAEIYPKEEELKTIQKIVSNTERALKFVSDVFEENSQENGKNATGSGNSSAEKKPDGEKCGGNIKDGRDNQMFSFQKENENGVNTPRLLKGVMRVGYLAKGLLLQGDSLVELVVLCSEKPTLGLLNRVADELPAKLKEVSSSNNANEADYSVELAIEDSAILVSDDAVTVKICLTSPLLRESQDGGAGGSDDIQELPQKTSDFLPREPCLQALAELRHAKWFQARATGLQSCVMVIRILRDLCQRVPSWQAMNQWALELLIEKVISSAGFPLSPGDCLRRIMEAVSTGLLINGPGILDPCEKEHRDALDGLTKQQREDLTVSAQQFLRLIAFRQIFKVLGMDQLPVVKFPMRPWRLNRKRRRSVGDGGNNDAGDDKPEEKLSKKENGGAD